MDNGGEMDEITHVSVCYRWALEYLMIYELHET